MENYEILGLIGKGKNIQKDKSIFRKFWKHKQNKKKN
jgi:hypothetical protein